MEPTIKRGERFRMTPLDLEGRRSLKRGDIVVFRMPGKPGTLQVRRIVALAGDRIEIKSKHLFVNGTEPAEPYVTHSDYLLFEGVARPEGLVRDQLSLRQIPTGRVFLLGDNRDNSLDSRFFGDVAVEDILGRVPGDR
jgi:signal peptidase I